MKKGFITRSKEERIHKLRILEAYGKTLVKDFDFNKLNQDFQPPEIEAKILKNRII